MRVELGIQLAIVAEQNANGFVRVDGAEFQVGAEVVVEVVAVVPRDLQAVGAADLLQRLIAGVARHGVDELLGEFEVETHTLVESK